MFVVKVRDHIVSIDSNHPDKGGSVQITGKNPAEIRRWISTMSGMRGIGLDGDYAAPSDLDAGLDYLKESFEILEGKEILDMPMDKLPDGCVW
jgi:hypothetical protein